MDPLIIAILSIMSVFLNVNQTMMLSLDMVVLKVSTNQRYEYLESSKYSRCFGRFSKATEASIILSILKKGP